MGAGEAAGARAKEEEEEEESGKTEANLRQGPTVRQGVCVPGAHWVRFVRVPARFVLSELFEIQFFRRKRG